MWLNQLKAPLLPTPLLMREQDLFTNGEMHLISGYAFCMNMN